MLSSGAKLTETGEGGVNGAHVPKHVSKENNPEPVNVIALLQSMEGENVMEKLMKIKSATTKSLAQVCIKAFNKIWSEVRVTPTVLFVKVFFRVYIWSLYISFLENDITCTWCVARNILVEKE